MFRAAQCSSSGESIVSIHLLVYVTLCGCQSSVQVGKAYPTCTLDGHPHSVTYASKLYWYNWISWLWVLCCSKHVENWNIRKRKKNCASGCLFTRIINGCLFKVAIWHVAIWNIKGYLTWAFLTFLMWCCFNGKVFIMFRRKDFAFETSGFSHSMTHTSIYRSSPLLGYEKYKTLSNWLGRLFCYCLQFLTFRHRASSI